MNEKFIESCLTWMFRVVLGSLLKAIALSPDGRESNVVSRVFNILPPPAGVILEDELEADCGDVLLTNKMNPPKPKKFEEIKYSQKSIILDLEEPQQIRSRCHYCNCEFAPTEANTLRDMFFIYLKWPIYNLNSLNLGLAQA